MRHDWIFDVLTDLRSYAEKNNLPAIAQQAEIALEVARKELTEKTKSEQAGEDQTQN
jgi:hypothetical protein